MNRMSLPGCTPVPLAGWLKAVGVLRLVAEQAAPQARGCWRQGRFELCGALDAEGLRRFFLHDYRPTPVVAPWNGGSGFFPKDNQGGIAPISEGQAPRLAPYRQAIEFGRSLLARLNISAKPDTRQKAELLRRFRAEAPEPVLDWFNAAVMLSGDDPRYPPLLGTGGNDGRLDFTNNFMQRLVDLFDPATGDPTPDAAGWLEEALFGVPEPTRIKGAIGQFSPGDAGGPNASTGFEGSSLINPWDFVLMIEGAMAFAAAVSR
ncbi:MAG: type I-U CRISPR-associated protein Csx17, partial [Acidobacteria bacterium]